MTELPRHTVRMADLPNRKPTAFTLEPDGPARDAIAQRADALSLSKFRFEGTLTPLGRRDWRLEARLGATVQQACVVTLDPVTTRVDAPVARTYAADFEYPEGDEVEMPEDDTTEPLPATLDLYDVAIEALMLAMPDFPRKDGAETGEDGRLMITEPGKAPMTDADARPFAGLGALRDALAKKADDDD